MSTLTELPIAATDISVDADEDLFEATAPSPKVVMRHRALRHWGFLAGGAVLLFTFVVAVLAPVLAPFDPFEQDLARRLINPVWGDGGSWAFPLGTDALGRDYLSRLMFGAQISLSVGFFAALLSSVVGSTLGMVGGYFGGRVDAFIMYIINCKLALPGLLIALSLVSIIGGSVVTIILILGFLFWDRFAVVSRAVTQQLRNQDFVTAAEAAGAGQARIIFGEILPNLLNHIIVVATLEMAVAILVEAALSFLGVGIQPPTPSWGLMVSEGRNFMFFKPYLIVIPGAAIFLLVIAINMMGDGIRDITAPEGRN
jgi:peptide/nickel transport system permease protein